MIIHGSQFNSFILSSSNLPTLQALFSYLSSLGTGVRLVLPLAKIFMITRLQCNSPILYKSILRLPICRTQSGLIWHSDVCTKYYCSLPTRHPCLLFLMGCGTSIYGVNIVLVLCFRCAMWYLYFRQNRSICSYCLNWKSTLWIGLFVTGTKIGSSIIKRNIHLAYIYFIGIWEAGGLTCWAWYYNNIHRYCFMTIIYTNHRKYISSHNQYYRQALNFIISKTTKKKTKMYQTELRYIKNQC